MPTWILIGGLALFGWAVLEFIVALVAIGRGDPWQ